MHISLTSSYRILLHARTLTLTAVLPNETSSHRKIKNPPTRLWFGDRVCRTKRLPWQGDCSAERKQSIGLKWFRWIHRLFFCCCCVRCSKRTKAAFQTKCKQITQFCVFPRWRLPPLGGGRQCVLGLLCWRYCASSQMCARRLRAIGIAFVRSMRRQMKWKKNSHGIEQKCAKCIFSLIVALRVQLGRHTAESDVCMCVFVRKFAFIYKSSIMTLPICCEKF